MKRQRFPVVAAAVLGALWVTPPDLWARGGGFVGGRGGGSVAGVGGVRAISGSRGFAAVRTPGFGARPGFIAAGRVAGQPAVVGPHFSRFDHGRRFHNVVFAGGGYGGYPYPFYGYYPNYNPFGAYAPNRADYNEPAPVAGPPPVASQCPGLVAGDVVGNVQRVLKYRGFYRGPIDGLSGPATRAAIRAYDASVGLPATGMIDARLLLSMQLM